MTLESKMIVFDVEQLYEIIWFDCVVNAMNVFNKFFYRLQTLRQMLQLQCLSSVP